MPNLERTYERIKDIANEKKEPLSFRDIAEYYTYIRSCFPDGDKVYGTSFLKLLITEFGLLNIKFEDKFSRILPVLYLYGPELVCHEMLINLHPALSWQGGTMMNSIVAEQFERNNPNIRYTSEQDSNINFQNITILDEKSFNYIRNKYEKYYDPIDYIAKLFLNLNLKEQITLSYNIVLERPIFINCHNIVGFYEAISGVVWRTLCNNFIRMNNLSNKKYLRFYQDSKINISNNLTKQSLNIDCIHNQMEVRECLKSEGTKNDLVTFEGIYLLNIMGYPTGTRSGPIYPHETKKGEYLYRLISPNYFNSLKEYQLFLYENKISSRAVNKGLTQNGSYREFESVLKKLDKTIKIRNNVKKVTDISLNNLMSQGLIKEEKSSYIIKKRPVFINQEIGKKFEVVLPTKTEIRRIMSEIYGLKQHIIDKVEEWEFNRINKIYT